jgi:hypothetical protein
MGGKKGKKNTKDVRSADVSILLLADGNTPPRSFTSRLAMLFDSPAIEKSIAGRISAMHALKPCAMGILLFK